MDVEHSERVDGLERFLRVEICKNEDLDEELRRLKHNRKTVIKATLCLNQNKLKGGLR